MEQTYFWIISIIESSSNKFQFKCCSTLIELFEAKYKDYPNWAQEMADDLRGQLDNQTVKYSVEV